MRNKSDTTKVYNKIKEISIMHRACLILITSLFILFFLIVNKTFLRLLNKYLIFTFWENKCWYKQYPKQKHIMLSKLLCRRYAALIPRL